MKRLAIVIVILGVIGLIGYKVYEYYIPRAISKALTSGESSEILPTNVKKKVGTLKTKVDKNIDKLPSLMKQANITYDDLYVMIDKADADQFFAAFDEVKLADWETTNEVFDIGLKHISIDGYDLESFREPFNSYATTDKINQWMEIIEKNKLLASMSIPMAKETAKTLLETKKEDILKKMEEL